MGCFRAHRNAIQCIYMNAHCTLRSVCIFFANEVYRLIMNPKKLCTTQYSSMIRSHIAKKCQSITNRDIEKKPVLASRSLHTKNHTNYHHRWKTFIINCWILFTQLICQLWMQNNLYLLIRSAGMGFHNCNLFNVVKMHLFNRIFIFVRLVYILSWKIKFWL